MPGRLDALNKSLPDGSDELRCEIIREFLGRSEILAQVVEDQTEAGKIATVALLTFIFNIQVANFPIETGIEPRCASNRDGSRRGLLTAVVSIAVIVVIIVVFLIWTH